MPPTRFSPFLALSATLLVALCGAARPQKAAAPRAATPLNALPLIVGAALGGLAIGSALSLALKKPAARRAAPDFASLLDEIPAALALVDADEKITRAGRAFCAFLGLSDATGTSISHFLHPDDGARFRTLWSEMAGGERDQFQLECRFFRADGALRHAILNAKTWGKEGVGIALQDVTEGVEARGELSGARAAMSALYGVVAGDQSRDLDAKIRALLAMGCGRFELPVGVLGRFCGDDLQTLFVQSADRRIRPALSFARGASQSSEARLLGLTMLPSRDNWREVPFVAVNENYAYLGAPVAVNGDLFGMLSFASLEAKTQPLSAQSGELLQLMAQWVGGEIERDETRRALENQQKALVEANQELERLATHDPLTGAKNRRAFNDKLAEEWSRARRYGTPLSLVLMDVDKFKSYNDSFGHPAGDEVLKKVALTLMAGVRTTDFFARYGGEEFVLLLPNTDVDGALILAERLRQKIEGANWKERAVTASMGVASLTPEIKDAAALTQRADEALYHSKENGRNRVTHARDAS